MQDTRLNRIVDVTADRFGLWLRNPWRRLSLQIILLLFGNFLGTAISTVAGQKAELDIVVAVLLVGLTELTSWLMYNRTFNTVRSFPISLLNTLKIGVIYSLFVEAFKLGS